MSQRPLLVQMLVNFAAAVGALTCTSEGAIAAQPDYQTVAEFLEHHEATRRTG